MPNIAAVLKEEIRRLAKKEIKAQVGSTKQAVVKYRSDIAKLKRSLSQQEREIKLLKKRQPQAEEELQEAIRFSARSVKAQRSRLGLSAADYGKLVGVSGLTIYNWEHGSLPPPQGPTCRPGCRPWHWQEGSVEEAGGIDAKEASEESTVIGEQSICS